MKLGSDYLLQARREKELLNDLNRVLLRGELARDPEIKTLPRGAVCNFQLITVDRWTDRNGQAHEKSECHKCAAWDEHAEAMAELKKGSRIYVEGRLQTRNWDDSSGQRRTSTEVIVSLISPA